MTTTADPTPAETSALLIAARLVAADDDTRAVYLPGPQGAALDRAVTKLAAEPCPGSGTTVSRWYAPHGWAYTAPEDITDPGPYTEGERAACRHCGNDVPVTPHATTERETGRQYVGRLAQH